ncbi:hypothetical protein QQ008_07340 [Fulvivirgaceae bacterium BMA10]|uniref:Uncharacterized protein n=1 Tax=Splendidivirga corallicola TaxID=3051826 RepID=A0ABT8KN83_9BACT|nr:hypothetical protein [Fulvivirgaceae bacterium BMA10]
MQITQALDLFIAIILIYFLLSTVCSGILEWFYQLFKKRNKILQKTILEYFYQPYDDNSSWGKAIYGHPQIQALKKRPGSVGPSYIPAQVFASVILDLVSVKVSPTEGAATDAGSASSDLKLTRFEKGISLIENHTRVKSLFRSFLASSNSFEELRSAIENWYDNYMDRVSGWFKRESKIYLFFIALPLAVLGNVNTIRLVDYYAKNEEERGKLVSLASTVVSDSPDSAIINIDRSLAAIAMIDTLGMPIGWKSKKEIGVITSKHILNKIDSIKKKMTESTEEFRAGFCGIRECVMIGKSGYTTAKCHKEFACGLKRLCPLDSISQEFLEKNRDEYQKFLNTSESQIDSLKQLYKTEQAVFASNEPGETVKKAWNVYHFGKSPREKFYVFLGWLITALAATQGASFWFQLLVRFVNIRNNGLKPAKAEGKLSAGG